MGLERTIVIFGDSLFDTGNLSAYGSLIGWKPFPAPVYSNGKPSDGLVLSETFLQSVTLTSKPLINRALLPWANLSSSYVNYAIAGAKSGLYGYSQNFFQIGLEAQASQFLADYHANKLLWWLTGQDTPEIDVVLHAGDNDIIDSITSFAFYFSPDRGKFERALIDQIVDDITGSIERMDPFVDDIVVFGLEGHYNSPGIRFFNLFFPGTIDFAKTVAQGVNQRLKDIYDSATNDNPDVFVVDMLKISDTLNSLGAYSFVDSLHTTESLNIKAAGLIANEVLGAFPDFTGHIA